MKKLFISCPMRNRTEENIKLSMQRMHKIAEIVFDQELEVISSYVEECPPENVNPGVWYLGKSIQKLAEADFFIGVDYYSDFFKGCCFERDIARQYGICSTLVDMRGLMPDALDVEGHYWQTTCKVSEISTS